MADGSRYLKCDMCDAVFDKRPCGDLTDGGTYRWNGHWPDIFRDAKAVGWTWDGNPTEIYTKHFCPKHTQKT